METSAAVKAFIAQYGLVAIAVGAVLEGDVTLLVSGMMAHLGILHRPLVLLAGFLGLVTSDVIWFAIGRANAEYLQRSALYRRAAPVVERIAGRAGSVQIVFARVVYGTRVASMLFWGAHGLGVQRFLLLDAIGCALWTVLFVAIGYGLTGSVEIILGRVKHVELWLAGGVVIAIVLIAVVRLTARYRAAHRPTTT
jgi:membrane protein DedA with SNARE-associated domain